MGELRAQCGAGELESWVAGIRGVDQLCNERLEACSGLAKPSIIRYVDTKQQASPARNSQSGYPVHVDGPKHIAVTCMSAGVRNASVVISYNELRTTNYADASCRPAVLHRPCVSES